MINSMWGGQGTGTFGMAKDLVPLTAMHPAIVMDTAKESLLHFTTEIVENQVVLHTKAPYLFLFIWSKQSTYLERLDHIYIYNSILNYFCFNLFTHLGIEHSWISITSIF